MPNSPFEIDESIARAAEAAGFTDVNRHRKGTVDLTTLPAQYLVKKPDYARIRRELEDGIVIPGCVLTDEYDYTLSKTDPASLKPR